MDYIRELVFSLGSNITYFLQYPKMSDDNIFSGISDAVGGELKKLGQAATHQVTGATSGGNSPSVNDISVVDQIKGFGKSAASQVTGSDSSGSAQPKADDSAVDEFKKFGQSFTKQLFGGSSSSSQEEQLAKMKKTDDDFSKQESEVIRAKIANIYKEYEQKRSREKKQEVMVEKQEEQQKEQLQQQQKKQVDIERSAEVAKTRAENKNYGAE